MEECAEAGWLPIDLAVGRLADNLGDEGDAREELILRLKSGKLLARAGTAVGRFQGKPLDGPAIPSVFWLEIEEPSEGDWRRGSFRMQERGLGFGRERPGRKNTQLPEVSGVEVFETHLDWLLEKLSRPRSAPRKSKTVADADAERWLSQQFADDPCLQMTKGDFKKAAVKHFSGKLSGRRFDDIWRRTAPEERKASGRKSKR